MSTAGKVIRCKAAVLWKPGAPLTMEEIDVAPPKGKEVRVKMVAAGICGTDIKSLDNKKLAPFCPIIMGHEGTGIVESVGEGVSTVKTGDKVIILCLPQCGECNTCLNSKNNICKEVRLSGTHLTSEGNSRITCKGKTTYQYITTGTFSEYIVIKEISVAKVDEDALLEKACIIGCGFATGFGAAINSAKVSPGSTCAVFGLGGVGLSVIMGCKAAGAARIIAVDTNKDKFAKAKTVGATECIDPQDFEKPIQQVLFDMMNDGADFTFEVTGNPETVETALASCHKDHGVCVIVGSLASWIQLNINSHLFFSGRTLKGSVLGGWKTKEEIPKLVSDYTAKKFNLDPLITHTLTLDKVNEAIQLMKNGQCIRCVLLP
ncbi:alcohol dehydrogenase 6 [Peromyscus maniculatus bairdii]|uniref:Alcohol dehydrogenase 6 n=2 Tax=Peromyscus maniculatus TaxID=10042 RepID=ADH6_PERMA|nr:alcohol dehydrogenase 6 [Peromyscus maniculatus bairdii]XP_042135936.1 alcohol dehydrogenase 6 [Peromyscus maniculatus bairdii]P41681.1 RecName: Full=Alcohol dehydrogenase 6; AltName: Full=Alcohol dehydrogenase 2; Short=ADH-2 [Peromyscus maniculatus]AAA40592.1 alcohol dehydrogenase 2 [Peromyscus maniculatus]